MKRVILMITLTALAFPPGAALGASELAIQHEPLECIVQGEFSQVQAEVSPPDRLDAARTYFRAGGTEDWYYIPMEGEALRSGTLPKPNAQLQTIEYYVQAAPVAGGEATRTAQFAPIVSTRTYCQDESLTVSEERDLEGVGLVIGLVREGAEKIPAGFSADGIATVIHPNGTVESLGGGSSASASAAAGAGAEGGGMASQTMSWITTGNNVWWVVGGAAVVGGAVYGVTEIAGGSSGGGGLGTGDLAFRLSWESVNDLDLYVEEPDGTRIYWGNRTSDSGGQLDSDANGSCEDTSNDPVENIFWPTGSAPQGLYKVWVDHWGNCDGPVPCPFTLRILRGGSTVRTYSGELYTDHTSTVWTYEY